MIPIAALRAMVAAGATIEVVLAAIEEDQKIELAERATELSRRREQTRIRTRTYRMRKAGDARDASQASQKAQNKNINAINGSGDASQASHSPVDTYLSKKDKKGTKESKKTLSMRACQIPPDFHLTEADVAFAVGKGFDRPRVQSEFERFCDHAAAGGRRQVDWHAAWRTWVTSPYQKPNGNGNGGHHGKRHSSDIARELADELRARERAAGIEGQADRFGGDRVGGPVIDVLAECKR